MIVIPPMPTRFRPLPELRIHLDRDELLLLAQILSFVKVEPGWREGLCAAVDRVRGLSRLTAEFSFAIQLGMNRSNLGENHQYLSSYLLGWASWEAPGSSGLTVEELAEIRQAWAKHIERSILEQVGDASCVTS